MKTLYRLTSPIGTMTIRATSAAQAQQSACADYLRGNGPVFHQIHVEMAIINPAWIEAGKGPHIDFP